MGYQKIRNVIVSTMCIFMTILLKMKSKIVGGLN